MNWLFFAMDFNIKFRPLSLFHSSNHQMMQRMNLCELKKHRGSYGKSICHASGFHTS